MMLRRGLRSSVSSWQPARRAGPSLSVRSFSSDPTARHGLSASALRRSQSSAPSLRSSLAARRLPMLSHAARVRFNSTTSTAAATASANASTTVAATPLDSAMDLTTAIPEAVPFGYLKSLGLDYGWGPTAFMEFMLDTVHVAAGAPEWWVSIAVTAALTRLIMLKPTMMASDNAARMQRIKPVTEPYMQRQKEAARLGDEAGMMSARSELQAIYKRADIKFYRSFFPLVQVFLGYGTFRLLRGMAGMPVPGFETGGLLWFSNLAMPDPFFILPGVTSFLLYRIFKFSFVCSSLLASGQSTLLRNASFREFFNLTAFKAPEEAPKAQEAANGLKLTDRAMAYQSPRGLAPAVEAPTSSFRKQLQDIQASYKSVKDTALQQMSGKNASGKRTRAELRKIKAADDKAEKELLRKRQEEREYHQWEKQQQKLGDAASRPKKSSA